MAYEKDKELDTYIQKVRAIPVLSREEEHELAVKVQEGDQEAADALVNANLRYVVAVALQYRRYAIRLADLIAEGNVGLVIAVRKFDPHRGTRFVTYAGYWIRAYILEAVVRSTSMVGAGSGPLRSKLFFRLRRERAQVATIERDPTKQIEMMAERFDTTPKKMAAMLRRLEAKDVSLDMQVFDDAGATLVDTLVSDGEGQDVVAERNERRARLQNELEDALDVLDKRERYIVENRLLQHREDEMTLAALGRELGVSRERARQLEARAKQKLRVRLRDFA